jgi:hypothetical protein
MATPKHRHHIVPRHAGGTDEPLNLTPPISIRLHACFHLDRWRRLGDVNDYIAYRFLRGQIRGAEAWYLSVTEGQRGRQFSPETRAKMCVAQRCRITEGRGSRKSPEARARQSATRKGRRDLITAAIAKVADANRARVWSAESKAMHADSLRRYWSSSAAAGRIHARTGYTELF